MSELTFVSDDLSDLDLLASALQEAVDARSAGVLGGPDLDELALRRAERRARRADAVRLLAARPADGAA